MVSTGPVSSRGRGPAHTPLNPARSKGGRPTKFTEDARDRFVAALGAGAWPETAAAHAGWSTASLHRYLAGDSPDHVAFRDVVQETLAAFEIRITGTIAKAAMTDPKWALILLERRFPSRWPAHPASTPVAEVDEARAVPDDDLVALDDVLIDALVPRLLEAGRAARLVGSTADLFDADRDPGDLGRDPSGRDAG